MPVMEWEKRVKVAIGAARGIAYLHEDCNILFLFCFCILKSISINILHPAYSVACQFYGLSDTYIPFLFD